MRAPDQRAHRGQVGQVGAERACLHQAVAESGRLGRPGEHGDAEGVGGELAEQGVLRAAADQVDDVDVTACEGRGQPDVAPVGERQAVQDRAGDRDRRARDRLTGLESQLENSPDPRFAKAVYSMVQEAPTFTLSWDQALDSATAEKMNTNLQQVFNKQITPEKFVSTMNGQ